MAENFIIELIASLKKGASKKQVQTDAKNLGDIKVPLVGTLNKTKTRAQLKQDLASMNGTVNLTGKFNSKGITASVQQAMSQAQKQADVKPVQMSFTVKKEKLVNDIKLLAQQNSRLFKEADMSIKYNTLLDSAQMARNTVELSALRTQLGAFRSELKVTGNAGLTMTDALRSGLSKVLYLFGSHGIIMQFTAQLRKAWTEAKELDSALTDLSRVNAEISRSDFPNYLDKVISKTKELSVATKDYIDAVTTFSRAGYNLTDSEILSDMSIQLMKVGDMDATSASKALLAGLQGYAEIDGYGMDQLIEKAQALNDKIDIIGNTASISQKEVAEGIQAVGSVMSDANTSVDEFLSLLAAGNRAVQDSNKVALAIRTSALRIRGCTVELQEMGEETDNVIESTSTLAAKIKALTNIDGSGGVDILEADEETFRSIYDIYNDIAKVYDKMSDTDASALLDLIAGKNRSNQISAILQNMSEANELLDRSLNAAGTASAEYEIYLASAEAATERFGVAMTETYNNILNGETVKGLTNATTAVLDFANKWGIVEGTLKGLLGLGVLKGITTLTVAFKNSALQVSNYGSALNAVKDLNTYTQGTRQYADAMKTLKSSCVNLTDAQLKQVLSNNALSDSERVKVLQYQGLTKAQAKAKLAQMGLTQTTNAQTEANGKAAASTFKFSSAVNGLRAKFKSFLAGNKVTVAIMAISAAISFVTSAISKYNQKLEEARQKAAELAEAYKQQQASLDSQIEKYKELKESLDKGNLSTDETRSIKEQLLEIQNSLIESYGNEASNIDLVNGKYREQLGLLSELSKEKANDFIIEHRDIYNEAKRALEEVKTYDLGTVTGWSNIVPQTEDQKRLIEFIESYSDLLELSYQGHSASYGGNDYVAAVNLSVKANVADADEFMHQFAADLERYINENNLDVDVSGLLENGIPEQIRNTWTDELKEYKEIYDEFMKAEIVRNDTLRPLYQQSIQAVEDYNNALSSGEGVEEAKTNLDAVQQSVQNATGELEGSQEVFDGIYDGINKSAESAYNLGQAFENDESVKGYAEKLKGLTDIDLQAINFEDNVQSPGEEAFKALIGILGLSENEVQNLIDKLVELGYVQGEIQNSTSDNVSLSIPKTISQLNTQLKPAFDSLKSAYQSIFTSDGFNPNAVDIPMLDSIKSSIEEINKLEDVDITIDMDAFGTLATTLAGINTIEGQAEQANLARQAFNDFATSIFYATNATDGITEETKELVEQLLESLGIVNATEVAEYALAEAKAKDMLATYDVINAKREEYTTILAEGEAAGIARQQLYKLMAAEIAFGNNDLSVENKINKLKDLAEQYGDTASAALATAIANDLASGHTDVDTAINNLMAQINTGIQKVDIDFSPLEKSAAKAGSSAGKSYADALKDELSNLNSVISYIGDVIDDQINLFEEQKDAAVDALEAEKETAEEALEAEKELVQEKIDAKQAEIDAIEEAAKARKNELDLQKAQYDLERMQNQKTMLQYTEDKGMIYKPDTKEAREAKEKFDEAKENIQIAGMEKEISGLNDVIDDLDKKIEESNEYYDKLIEETEKYWDGLIKGLEEYKSRWQELADIEEQAKMEVMLRNLGITTEDVLNMSESAFESFKGTYLGLLDEMYSGNDEMINMLQKFGGISTDTLKPLSGTIDTVADSLDNFAVSTGNAGTNTSAASESIGSLSSNTSELNSNLSGVSDTLDNMLEGDKLETVAEQMGDIAESVQSVSDALNDMPDDIDLSKPIEQFNAFGNAVDKVSSSISGGNVSKAESGEPSGKNTPNVQGNSGSNGSSGLVGAIKEIRSETDKSIGTGEDSGAVGQFNQLGESVMDVTAAIGGGSESRGGEKNGEGSDSLISSIENLGETTAETLGEPDGGGAIGRFGELGDTIAEAEGHVNGIIDGMNELDGMTAECSIVVNVETRGGVPAYAEGTAISDAVSSMGSGEYHPKYEGSSHVEGSALVSGNWAVQSNEGNSLVGEEGYEIVVRNGRFFTVGDNGPEMFPIKKGDIVFNHNQSEELLKNGRTSGRGKAYADGTVGGGKLLTKDGVIIEPYNPDTDTSGFAKLYKAWNKYYGNMDDNVEKIQKNLSQHLVIEHNQQMNKEVNEFINRSSSVVNNRNVQPNITFGDIHVTCPGVTDKQVAQYVPGAVKEELRKEFTGFSNLADQWVRR